MNQFQLEISVNGPVNQVFEAWHLPERLQKWFCPGDMLVGQVMSNFCEGGTYAIKMQEPNGDAHWLQGEYTSVTQNEKLAFTWQWRDEDHATFVVVTFKQRNPSTCDITLIHQGFTEVNDRDIHQQAWLACLEKLSMLAL